MKLIRLWATCCEALQRPVWWPQDSNTLHWMKFTYDQRISKFHLNALSSSFFCNSLINKNINVNEHFAIQFMYNCNSNEIPKDYSSFLLIYVTYIYITV